MSNPSEQAPAPADATQTQPAPAVFHDTSDFPPAPVDPNPAPAPNAGDDGLPEKYRGKTIAEIVTMHQNAESELGRARNEVGTIRRLADELIGIRRADLAPPTPAKPPREKLTTDALLGDPEAAITSVIAAEAESRDADLRQRTARLEAELALATFEKKHPGYKQTMEDASFAEWVKQTPYRARLAQGAIQGDFAAADELFSLYSERSATSTAPSSPPPADPTDRARSASLVRPGGSTAAGVVQGGAGKKIWSRAELIRMRIHEPEKFDSLYASEIEPAYREKRVR